MAHSPPPTTTTTHTHTRRARTAARHQARSAPRTADRELRLSAQVDYRKSGEATFPACIHDCKAAVRWVRAEGGAKYGLSPARLGAVGSSAGGHLASLLGTSAGVAALEGAGLGCASASSGVDAVVAIAPPTDLLAACTEPVREPPPSTLRRSHTHMSQRVDCRRSRSRYAPIRSPERHPCPARRPEQV